MDVSKSLKQRRPGFTLIELLISVSVFALVMMAVTQIFGTSIRGYREARRLQTNLDQAQYSLNLMAKELRTSSMLVVSASGTSFDITFIDYSQDRCVRYIANNTSNGKLLKYNRVPAGATPDAKRNDCTINPPGTYIGEIISDGITDARIEVVQSEKFNSSVNPYQGIVGRVVICLTFGDSNKPAIIQTSVSLRDYNYVGI